MTLREINAHPDPLVKIKGALTLSKMSAFASLTPDRLNLVPIKPIRPARNIVPFLKRVASPYEKPPAPTIVVERALYTEIVESTSPLIQRTLFLPLFQEICSKEEQALHLATEAVKIARQKAERATTLEAIAEAREVLRKATVAVCYKEVAVESARAQIEKLDAEITYLTINTPASLQAVADATRSLKRLEEASKIKISLAIQNAEQEAQSDKIRIKDSTPPQGEIKLYQLEPKLEREKGELHLATEAVKIASQAVARANTLEAREVLRKAKVEACRKEVAVEITVAEMTKLKAEMLYITTESVDAYQASLEATRSLERVRETGKIKISLAIHNAEKEAHVAEAAANKRKTDHNLDHAEAPPAKQSRLN